MSTLSSGFLARFATRNHASGLENGEIFIIEPNGDSKFIGKSLKGEVLNGIFEETDFNRLSLPSGRFAVSTGEYETMQQGHLSFMKFTLLSIEEEFDERWFKGSVTLDSGKRLGNPGLFPACLVVELPTIEQIETMVGLVIESLEPKLEGEIALSKGECVRILESKAEWYTVQRSNGIAGLCPKTFLKIVENSQYQEDEIAMEPYCIALYDFNSEHDTELSFAVDDVIKLFRWVDHEWLEGENQRTGFSGYIPGSFVQVIIPPPAIKAQFTGDSLHNVTKVDDCTTIGIATVLYGFEARYGDELSVEAGASIKVLGIQGDWVKCWNPDTDETGIVPRSYLRIFSDYDDASGTGSRVTNSIISTTSDNEDISISNVERPWEVFEDSKPITRSTSASMFLSSGMESIEDKKTPPARPPPPKFPLPVPSIPTDNGLQLQLRKNQQPVQRMAPSRPRSMTKIYSVPSTQTTDDRTSEGWESRRIKVLDEIIQSETAYLFDISAWEAAVENNPHLSESKKKMILNGYSMLKYLSRGLTSSLIAEQTKPIIDQEVGLKFMQLKEVFYKTYGQYFRSAEQVSEIIVRGDDQVQKALQESLEEMRKNGSNVFDVPTALSRPIQRCLKYPLYLSEIVKNTPLTHPDHPKLMEALKQMGQLATKMNESKRRKELAKKYSKSAMEQRDTGFLNKLSKFNIHSIMKKSSRLQYRITTRIGFSSTYHDDEFDQLLKTLEEVQQRFCHLIYQMTVYKNRIVRLAKKYVEINTIIKIPPGQEPSIRFEHNNLLRRLLVYAEELNSEIVELCCTAQELAKRDFTFIVHKRYDKLADWEMAVRAKKPIDIIDMRKCEFEALNSQLKIIFPKEIDKLIDGLRKYVKRIKQTDSAFFKRVRGWLDEFKTTNPPDFRKYVDPKSLRLRQIENTLRTKNPNISAKLCQAREPEQSPSVDSPSDQPPPLVYEQPVFGRSQTKTEREKLIKLCRALGFHESLCKVKENYISDDGKFVLKKGDVIRERSIREGKSIIENGLATYKVPSYIYKKVKHPFSTTLADTSDSGDASDSDADLNLKSIQKFLASQEQARLSNESPRQFQSNDQQQFGIPDEIVKKIESQRSQINNRNGRDSVNWLQYDDKIIDLPGLEDYSRPAPAPPEAMSKWTTFDNDNDTPRIIVPPQNVFGSLHNPIPMEPIRLSTTEDSNTYSQVFEGDLTWRAPPPEPKPQPVQLSPTNPFRQNQNRHSSIHNYSTVTRPQQPSRKSEPDLLARLVNEEIAKTKDMSAGRRSVSPNLPNPPTTAPPEPPMNKKPPLPKRDYKDNSIKNNNNNAISKYDFIPIDNDGVQLKMIEGEHVKVLRRHDDAENPEWWLVSNSEGKAGYVPATYLSLNS